VVAALKAQSIDGARLSSAGFGPDKPISPNDTEDGRAKNRRVELVKN
jgi:outer membrane protein OmpA-like peptidoglycan-associated protein